MIRRPRQRVSHEVDSEGTWALSYGDMVTLLLTFFIIFFSLTPENRKRKDDLLLKSLVAELSAPDRAPGSTPEPVVRVGKDKNAEGVDERILKDWGGKVQQIGNRVVVEFPAISFFESGELKVRPQAEAMLKTFVKHFLPYAGHYELSICAFTDRRPVVQITNRRFKDNLELSALRAISAMRILQRSGLPLSQMRIGGNGEFKFISSTKAGVPQQILDSYARSVMLIIDPERKPSA